MNKIASELEKLLEAAAREEALHQFLYKHSYLLAEFGYGVKKVFSKPSFGSDFKADFAMVGWGNYECWTFVEIKKSTDKLFTKEGLPSKQLNKAISQINNWWIWMYDHGGRAGDFHGDLVGEQTALIVIGRRRSLSKTDLRRLKQFNATQLAGKLNVITFDAILDYAKSLNFSDIQRLEEKCRSLNEFKSVKDFRNRI